MADCRKLRKGDPIYLAEPKTLGDGKQLWAFLEEADKVTPEASPPSDATGKGEPGISPSPIDDPCCAGKSLMDWKFFVREAWTVAKNLERDDAQARVALVNTAVIAWTHGAITYKTPEDVPF
jgi:hypothetical protein